MPTSVLDLPGGTGRHPAIVGLHPADDASRDHYLFRHLANVLVPADVAVARFDRRGYDVPFEDQVADALAVIADLRTRPEIDATRIGLWGFSQGAWVAPMVAARTEIAFLVLVASTGVSPSAQMDYGTAKHLRDAGYGEAEVERLLHTRKAVAEWRRGHRPVAEAQAAVDEIADAPWRELAYLPRDLARTGAWPDMDFDPAETFGAVRCPVLLFYGEDDEWQPTEASVAAWERAGVPDLTVVRLRGTGHAPTMGGVQDIARVSPDYERELVTWVSRVARSG